jgi:hypothetical protein
MNVYHENTVECKKFKETQSSSLSGPLPLDKGRSRGIRLVGHYIQIPPNPPLLKGGKNQYYGEYFHPLLVPGFLPGMDIYYENAVTSNE